MNKNSINQVAKTYQRLVESEAQINPPQDPNNPIWPDPPMYPLPPITWPPPGTPPVPPTGPRMAQWSDPNPRNPRKPGRGGRTTGAERGPRNPPVLPPPPNINWANIWRQYSGSGYNNEILQGLYLQAQRAGYNLSFGDFYATLVAQYGGSK